MVRRFTCEHWIANPLAGLIGGVMDPVSQAAIRAAALNRAVRPKPYDTLWIGAWRAWHLTWMSLYGQAMTHFCQVSSSVHSLAVLYSGGRIHLRINILPAHQKTVAFQGGVRLRGAWIRHPRSTGCLHDLRHAIAMAIYRCTLRLAQRVGDRPLFTLPLMALLASAARRTQTGGVRALLGAAIGLRCASASAGTLRGSPLWRVANTNLSAWR